MPRIPNADIIKAKAKDAKPIRMNEYQEYLMQTLFEQFERRCTSPHLVLLCDEVDYTDLRSLFF